MLAAYIDWSGRAVDPRVMRQVAASLGIGGPSPAGIRTLAPGMFAAIADLAELVETRGGGALLFHGFLQNRAELRTALGVPGLSDGALYAAACERWGVRADERVIGEYAALIIEPDARRVRMVRAPIVAPPLHIHRSDTRLIVASTARAIFATGMLRAEVDEQKIADSLFLNYAEGSRDWFRGVTRLPLASAALHGPDWVCVTSIHDLARVPELRLKSDADYVEAASALLAEATRAALDGRLRPAIALSGGLDSQLVAVAVLAERPGDLLALTGVPEPSWDGVDRPGSFADERAHVAALAARYPALRTETVAAAGRSFDHRLDEMFLHAGGPPRNAMNLHWLHDLHARAHAQRCDVLLTGAYGNFTLSFDGSGMLASLFRSGRWWRMARAARGRSLARTIASEALWPNVPTALRCAVEAWRHAGDPLPAWCPLTPQHAARMRVVERARSADARVSTRAWRLAMLRGAAGEAADVDQAMQAIHRVPLRDPTAYRPLVEFCMGLPDEQFWCDGVRRRLARRMLRGKAPECVVDEPRIGAQAADWSIRLGRQREALRDEIDDLGRDPAMAERLDLPRLARALDQWPADVPPGDALRQTLQLALPRALATARFIRSVEGGNAYVGRAWSD